jgi:hypothetical protein
MNLIAIVGLIPEELPRALPEVRKIMGIFIKQSQAVMVLFKIITKP